MKSPFLQFLSAVFSAVLATFTCTAQATDSRAGFSGEVYSQSLLRFESRVDRGRGFFHVTRLRGSYEISQFDFARFHVDAGSYLLGEWAWSFADQALPQNLMASPYFGFRMSEQISETNWILSGSLNFEGRMREPLSEGARATGTAGWDPRSSAVIGFWWMNAGSGRAKPFVDIYGDAISAPKFSDALLSTIILRSGVRRAIDGILANRQFDGFLDGYAEFFSQNAPTLDLGTKRSELRLGLALGHTLPGGTAQLRVWHGFPQTAISGEAVDRRSRTEALLILGYSLGSSVK